MVLGIRGNCRSLGVLFHHAVLHSAQPVSSGLQAVFVGLTNLVFTMVAMSVIDKIGRRKLLLTGAVGTSACLAGVAGIYSTGKHADLLIWLLAAYI
jgi:MFS transporter, SP family, arabinose:H+ symporter